MKHTKFKKVEFNNKKRVFKLSYNSGLVVECPYAALGIKEKVVEAAPDKEVGGHSFYFILENGKQDYVPFDQPLYISNNPDYMRQELMFELTMNILSIIEDVGISKRELARSLKTSVTQINRLLDQTNYNKDLSRLIQIASLLNYDFDWEFKKVA
jgi:hypothetical protein